MFGIGVVWCRGLGGSLLAIGDVVRKWNLWFTAVCVVVVVCVWWWWCVCVCVCVRACVHVCVCV